MVSFPALPLWSCQSGLRNKCEHWPRYYLTYISLWLLRMQKSWNKILPALSLVMTSPYPFYSFQTSCCFTSQHVCGCSISTGNGVELPPLHATFIHLVNLATLELFFCWTVRLFTKRPGSQLRISKPNTVSHAYRHLNISWRKERRGEGKKEEEEPDILVFVLKDLRQLQGV